MGRQLTATTPPDDIAVVPSSARPTRHTLAHEMHRVTSHHWESPTENYLWVTGRYRECLSQLCDRQP